MAHDSRLAQVMTNRARMMAGELPLDWDATALSNEFTDPQGKR